MTTTTRVGTRTEPLLDALGVLARLPGAGSALHRALNRYGDRWLFGRVSTTPPIACNPEADTGLHTAVPHRYVHAYLLAIKSFLRYHADIAVTAHDDGTLDDDDRVLIRHHLPGARIVDREWADREFTARAGDDFLTQVRSSYTSYLKLFDPGWVGEHRRIIVVDTDVLFLRPPLAVIDWARDGGPAWYHRHGAWHRAGSPTDADVVRPAGPSTAHVDGHGATHIQQLVEASVDEIGHRLQQRLEFVHGFNSGLLGYERGTVSLRELGALLAVLHEMFGERIFRWGSEQTVHGLLLCSRGAVALRTADYTVHTEANSDEVDSAAFVHFIGEFRYHGLVYPRLARAVLRELAR